MWEGIERRGRDGRGGSERGGGRRWRAADDEGGGRGRGRGGGWLSVGEWLEEIVRGDETGLALETARRSGISI